MSSSSGWILTEGIVLADGCFDPIHYGHVRYLRSAKKLGDVLIVNMAPDSVIIAKGRKVFQERAERSKTLAALYPVNEVVEYPSLEEAVAAIRPSVLVKGCDWAGRLPKAVWAACDKAGVRVVYVDTQERTSTERLA